MPAAAQYFVRINANPRGPLALDELRRLAERGEITPDTEAAPTPEGPWSLMITLPERATIFPARVALAARPDFATTSDCATPLQLADVIAAAQTPGRVLKSRSELQAAVYREPSAAAAPNEVEIMVRAVQAQEAALAPPPPAPPRRRRLSVRLGLVLTLAVLGNAGLLALMRYYEVRRDDELTMLVLGGWFVIGNGGLVYLYTLLPRK